MKVLLFGSRNWTDKQYIRDVISAQGYYADTLFIHGDNGYRDGQPLWGRPDAEADEGADKLAGAVAEELGFPVERFPADWRRYGRRAGPRRNREMARQQPDEALCFHPDLHEPAPGEVSGTWGMYQLCQERGIPVAVFDGKPDPLQGDPQR